MRAVFFAGGVGVVILIVCHHSVYIFRTSRFQQRQQGSTRNQNFALSGDAKRLKPSLPNVGAYRRLTDLQILGCLFDGK